jgi:hypothetical protein
MTPPIIGYPRACREQRESWALFDPALLRGPSDVVPPMDRRVPKLVRAREFVRQLREEGK